MPMERNARGPIHTQCRKTKVIEPQGDSSMLKSLFLFQVLNAISKESPILMTEPMASLELIFRLRSRRCRVLLHKRCQVLEVPLPTVLLSLFPILVDVEGGEAVDTVAAAQFSIRVAVGRAVHMADSHLGVVLVFLSRLLPGRCQPLTVTAPGGKELDEGDAGFDLSLEVVLVKLGNRRGGRGLGHLAILGSRLASLALGCSHELLQLGQGPSTLVGFQFGSRPEVGKSGVAADLVLLADSLVLGAVHLRNLHLFIFFESLGQLLPGRSQLLAMAAPRCIELYKGVSLGDRGSKRGGREDMKSCFNHSLS